MAQAHEKCTCKNKSLNTSFFNSFILLHATGPAHKVKIISIFISINQPKSSQQINIKVTLYKTFNPSRLYNFNKASV